MFLEDDIFAEMGHAITNWIFGGEGCMDKWNTSEEALFLGKVPHSFTVKEYRVMGFQYPVSAPVPRKRTPSAVYQIPP
ncbi:hypothetical protein AC579_1437 [Pseudocercospora musae]|uniref:Uncharacterized protein n=1 Tax=Pseudocercospora musae TaxID=113226 RepID=A0A139IMN2_9PEZI|nr:hypothetical protein AC579_1437 [Pseudocercospora musae]